MIFSLKAEFHTSNVQKQISDSVQLHHKILKGLTLMGKSQVMLLTLKMF